MQNQQRAVEIPQDVSNYIESLDYETNARKDIITTMLSANMGVNTEAFTEYHKQYNHFRTMFETVKQELEQKYMPTEWRGHNVAWRLDYETRVITFTKNCSC